MLVLVLSKLKGGVGDVVGTFSVPGPWAWNFRALTRGVFHAEVHNFWVPTLAANERTAILDLGDLSQGSPPHILNQSRRQAALISKV